MIRFKQGLCVLVCVAAVFGLLNIMPLQAEAATMTSSTEMVDVLKQMEGFSLYPYWDYAQYTVGYGTRCPEEKRAYYSTYGISEEEALALLREELNGFEEQVNNFVAKRNLTIDQGQFDALVSLTYNCGGGWMSKTNSNLFRAVTSGSKGEDLLYAFTLYSIAGGKYEDGLIKRRLCEANMYINGIYKAANVKDGVPANYKWVFLDGNGATIDGGVFGFDVNNKTKVKATFTEIPTGVDAEGKPFAYKMEGWYTSSGKKVVVLDSSLANGETLKAKWVDPEGNALGNGGETPVEVAITVTGNDVSIRTGPSTSYNRVGYANKGDKYTVTAVATGSGLQWGKIGEDAWICLDYTDYKAPEDPDGGDTEPEAGFPKNGTVNADDVNVRTGPSTGYNRVYQLDKGAAVTIVEENRNSNPPWGKLKDGNWIRLDFVDYDGQGIVSVELVTPPEKTIYESMSDMLRLEGSVLFVTYADGSSEAMSLTSEMIKDYSMTGAKEATVTAEYKGFTVKFTVTIAGVKLAIAKQPKDAYANAGETVTVTLVATGEGLQYQWFAKKNGEETFAETTQTTTTYTVEMTEELDGCQLYCLVSDEHGQTVDSDVVTLHLGAMTAPIVITKQPQNVVVKIGEHAATTVEASGEGLKYQWYYKDKNDSQWSVSSLTGTTYGLTLTAARDGRQVYCQITDKYGNTINTDTITISSQAAVTPEPQGKIEITKQPQNVIVKVGERAETTVEASGEGLKYQWYYKDKNDSQWSVSSLTGTIYGLTLTAARDGRQVYCQITDKYGNTVKTDTITISSQPIVTPEPEPQTKLEISKQPTDVVVHVGEKATTSVTAKGDGLKYQWYYKDTDESDWSASTLTTDTYSCEVSADRAGRLIYCVITDKYGNSVQTDTVKFNTVEAIRAENPDMQDAIEELRAKMVNRETVITVEYLADSAVTKENNPASDLLFTALAHTGNPKEGDYLYRHCKSLKYSIDSVAHPGGHWVTATYTITYRTTAQQEEVVDQAVAKILSELNVSGASNYEKISAIYGYLCKNVTFDYVGTVMGSADIYSTYSALVKGKAVCHGFATAFYRLALELNVDTRLIAGKYETTSHGWNIVKIGNKYYNVDATRDAGNTPDEYQYFLMSDANMPKHVRSNEYATPQFYEDYPMATDNYVPGVAVAGDMNGDGVLDTSDAVYLLLNTMFGNEDYAIADSAQRDTNGDGNVTTADAVYLLLHVMFGAEDYPLGGVPGANVPTVPDNSAIVEFLDENEELLISTLETVFFENSGMTCTTTASVEGMGIVITMTINELDGLDEATKQAMQEAYDAQSATFETALTALQEEVPELEYYEVCICECDGDLIVTILAGEK